MYLTPRGERNEDESMKELPFQTFERVTKKSGQEERARWFA